MVQQRFTGCMVHQIGIAALKQPARPFPKGRATLYGTIMNRAEFNTFCGSLKHATHVVQWGNSDVWKVGGKLFSVCGWADDVDAFTFKVTDLAYEILPDMPGLRPAPYLASRGMKWIQHYAEPGLSDTELKNHIQTSYDLVVAKLTKKLRADLGL